MATDFVPSHVALEAGASQLAVHRIQAVVALRQAILQSHPSS